MMESKKIDRRINRTRKQLREALLSLIIERGYDSVTINQITSRADLGRTTFYLHYKDKEDLLLESIDANADDLVAQIKQIPLSAWKVHKAAEVEFLVESPIRLIFEHAAQNATLYKVILWGEGGFRATGRLRDVITQAIDEFLQLKTARENLTLHPEVPIEVFSNYFAGSLMGLLSWWLENDLPYPPDVMADMFQKMFFSGARAVLGIRS